VKRRDAAALVLAAALGAVVVPDLALRFAGPAILNLGPNDDAYVQGFRSGWERDGRTTFRWATLTSSIVLPLRASGEGHRLRLRVRRHFIEPSVVTLTLEDRVAARFEVVDDRLSPYHVIEVPLPRLRGTRPLALQFEARSTNPRPLAMAVDWVEVTPGREGFRPNADLRVVLAVVLVAAFLAPRLAGASLAASVAHAAALAVAAGAGLASDPIAGERILRLGTPVYVVVAGLALALATLRPGSAAAAPGGRPSRLVFAPGAMPASLVVLTLAALAARLLILHPQFYYPDVKAHAMLAWHLAREGLLRFLQDFTVHQYRYSLGLQFESGHWYAFPYPPAFYVLAWPLVRVAGLAPEVAVSVLGAAVNALEVLLIHAVARRVTGSARAALAAAGAAVVLPIFLVRLGLAYFPALVGHAVDVLVLLYLLERLDRLERPSTVLKLGSLIGVALLTYTQSLLNFGLILPACLLIGLAGDRSPGARRRLIGLAAAGALGAALALALFYARYVPVFLDMRRGVPMSEERVLEELNARRSSSRETQPPRAQEEPPDDPYAGPDLDLWRGVQKAAWRLWIFYGPFAPLVAASVVWIVARADRRQRPLLGAWAFAYVALNLASGGLPGPNLVRYNKDVEVVAPLCCAGLGRLAATLWERGRVARLASVALSLGFLGYGSWRGARALLSTFVLER
jgi:hypothetical protein